MLNIPVLIKRLLYLALGMYALFEGYSTGEIAFYVLGGVLVLQATFKVTCLAGGACQTPKYRSH